MSSQKPVLLVVDDRPNMLRLMSKVMKRDATVLTANNGAEALRHLVTQEIHAVLCDLKMPDMSGLEVLRASKRLRPLTEFVVMTAYGSVGTAVEALKLGAFDYITKPFEPAAARSVLLVAMARSALNDPESGLEAEVLPGLVSRSRDLQDLADRARTLANEEPKALLLVGEPGTGRGSVARALHLIGPRASGPFVHLNCGEAAAGRVELELFGSHAAPPPAACAAREGALEQAKGGVLWIEEVGSLRPSLQQKLADALRSRTASRADDTTAYEFDALVICSTRHNLNGMVSAGAFRPDLAALLTPVLEIPPLRARPADIDLLAYRFLREFISATGTTRLRGISRLALDAMTTYEWPGNLAQLRHVVETAASSASGPEIELDDLPIEIRGWPRGIRGDLGTWTDAMNAGRFEFGRRYLEGVLKRFDGRVSDAASFSGVERESFYRLLRRHRLNPDDFREAST